MINFLFGKKIVIILHRDTTDSYLTITERFRFEKNQNKSIIVDAFVAENYPDWIVISHT